MAANNTGDDITFGQTNAGQDGTELRADANDEGGFGNDFVLQLGVSPVIIHRNDRWSKMRRRQTGARRIRAGRRNCWGLW